MILEVIRVGLLRLWHGRIEMLLTFVVPIVFFTIFALIFDKQAVDKDQKPTATTAVDLDGSDASRDLIAKLSDDALTRFTPLAEDHGASAPVEALEEARRRVVQGEALVAVVVPEGWGDSLTASFDPSANSTGPAPLQMLADTSDPISPRLLRALLQAIAGEIAATQAPPPPTVSAVPPAVGALPTAGAPGQTPGLPTAPVGWPPNAAGPAAAQVAILAATPGVTVIDLLSSGKSSPQVSMYAAGIAVMFLLFSAVGAGGSLLEEEESQTLERLMASGLGMTRLILGKWLQLLIVGAAQVTVMFVWAQVAFGVRLTDHLGGFTLMTLATSAAAASLALVLAAACRTRAQLNAISVILILTMSALGGSMAPRYVMSESMQQWGRLTFNAWAIDGYEKLFWRGLPPTDLGPELIVLTGSATVLLVAARLLASRWETA